jgi:hypothetical protein
MVENGSNFFYLYELYWHFFKKDICNEYLSVRNSLSQS